MSFRSRPVLDRKHRPRWQDELRTPAAHRRRLRARDRAWPSASSAPPPGTATGSRTSGPVAIGRQATFDRSDLDRARARSWRPRRSPSRSPSSRASSPAARATSSSSSRSTASTQQLQQRDARRRRRRSSTAPCWTSRAEDFGVSVTEARSMPRSPSAYACPSACGPTSILIDAAARGRRARRRADRRAVAGRHRGGAGGDRAGRGRRGLRHGRDRGQRRPQPSSSAGSSAGSSRRRSAVRRVLRRSSPMPRRATWSDRSRPSAASRCSSSSSGARRPTDSGLGDPARAAGRRRRRLPRVRPRRADWPRRIASSSRPRSPSARPSSAAWPRSSSPRSTGHRGAPGARAPRPRPARSRSSRTRPRRPTSSGRRHWPRRREVAEQLAGADDADWVAIAEEHSDDPGSAARGGDLGWYDPAAVAASSSFTAALAALEVGEISEPVRTDFGYHVIQKTGRAREPAGAGRRLIERLARRPGLPLPRSPTPRARTRATAADGGELGWVAR